jgi:hypothetical protein
MSPDLLDGSVADQRQWLYDGDFEQHQDNVLAGPAEEDMSKNFDTIRNRVINMGVTFNGTRHGHLLLWPSGKSHV